MKQTSNAGKGVIAFVVTLAFLIPMLLAGLFLRENLSPDLTRGTVEAVRLIHGVDEERITAKEEVDFFISVVSTASPIEKAADDLGDYRLLKVVFEKFNQEYSYSFYLSDSENNCVFADPSGSLFLIPSDLAVKLQGYDRLNDYALSFADRPVATLYQGETEYESTLAEGTWTYLRADGAPHEESVKKEGTTVTDLPQGEKLNLRFSIEPDYCSVAIMKDGEQLFSDDYSKLSVIHLEKDTSLTVTVIAQWYEKEDKSSSYYGKITYTFDVFYNVPTSCTLEKSEVKAGEELKLVVSHSSTPQLAVTASFAAGKITTTKDGDSWLVTIPVSKDALTGESSLMVMGSDVEQTIPVTILPK